MTVSHILSKIIGDIFFKSGTISESEEMAPKWYNFNEIPYDQMWLDDRIWYPTIFEEEKTFQGYFLFRGHNKVLQWDMDIEAK